MVSNHSDRPQKDEDLIGWHIQPNLPTLYQTFVLTFCSHCNQSCISFGNKKKCTSLSRSDRLEHPTAAQDGILGLLEISDLVFYLNRDALFVGRY